MSEAERKRAKIGDIVEVPTPKGLVYAQYMHKHPQFGGLIRVLRGFFASRPAKLTALVEGPDRFKVFFLLAVAVREKEVTIVGHEPVPEQSRPFPLLRVQGWLPNPADGPVNGPWWLSDGNREWKVGPLTEEMRSLLLRELWDATMLVQMLMNNWDPRQEGLVGFGEEPNWVTGASGAPFSSATESSQDALVDGDSGQFDDEEDEDEHPEQAVLLLLKLSDDAFGQEDEREALFGLEDRLEEVVVSIGGILDGHEFGAGFCTFYLYGASADALFETVAPLLRKYPVRDGSYAVKRYGPPGSSAEERVNLTIA